MKILKRALSAASVLAILALATPDKAQAQSIWTNAITDSNPSASNPFTTGQTSNANITVSGIGRGTGINANAGSNRYNANGWNSASFDANDYFTFTLDANTGFEIDFVSFVYSAQLSSGSINLAFRSSLDNYATNIGTPTSTGATISLSGAAYQNLTAPITFRLYGWGASAGTTTFSVNDFTFNGTVSAAVTGNNTTIAASTTTVALGRVMQTASNPTNNVTLNKTGTDTTTYTTTAGGQATVADAGTSFAAGTQNDQISVGINRSTTGAKTGTVTVVNTATTSAAANQGSADGNDVINVSGTVVANRTITAGSVNLGKVLVGTTTGSQASSLTTTGADLNNTRVTVNGTAASSGGVTVAAGSSQLFNEATDTIVRNVSGTFSTSGAKNVNVNLSVTGEGLTGEAVNAVTVNATADVYQAASLTANNSSDIATGGTISVGNANTSDGGQRAAAEIISKTLTGDDGWSVSGLTPGTVINQNSNASGTATFDTTGKLNGTHVGTLVLGFEHADQTIQGTAAADLGTRSWNMSHLVEGVTASTGNATVQSNGSYAGFSLTNNSGAGTQAELLGGTASGETEIAITFSAGNPGATNDASRISDVVNLTGTDGDLIVMQLSYTGDFAATDVYLAWFDGASWVLAVNGNSTGSPTFVNGAYTGQSLGSYGVDLTNKTVWAVIDHNSEFSVIAVPEPGAFALMAAAGTFFMVFRRRRQRA